MPEQQGVCAGDKVPCAFNKTVSKKPQRQSRCWEARFPAPVLEVRGNSEKVIGYGVAPRHISIIRHRRIPHFFTIHYYLLLALLLLSQSAKEQIFRRLRRQNVCLIVLWIIRIPNPNK